MWTYSELPSGDGCGTQPVRAEDWPRRESFRLQELGGHGMALTKFFGSGDRF